MIAKEQLHAVETAIRQALPRLMEPTEGCIIEDTEERIYKIVSEIKNGEKKEFWITHLYSGGVRLISESEIAENYKIIGHDILLSDVLEWLGRFEHKASIHSRAEFVVFVKKVKYTFTRYSACIDFSKPHLKDQSEEFINFLYNLIKNN